LIFTEKNNITPSGRNTGIVIVENSGASTETSVTSEKVGNQRKISGYYNEDLNREKIYCYRKFNTIRTLILGDYELNRTK
jgi:hypothetical protein